MASEVLSFYDEVLRKEASGVECVSPGLQCIREAYRQTSRGCKVYAVDYNSAAKRYAYIYYYAPCHTVALTRLLRNIEEKYPIIFHEMMLYSQDVLNVCSIGGGPGSDLIGLLRARSQPFFRNTKKINCTVVDISSGWKSSLQNVLETYTESSKGNMYHGKLQLNFLKCDLQKSISLSVMLRLACADILNLVKFVSVLPVSEARLTLKVVFNLLHPGAYVIFMDNSAGGSYETVKDAANEAGLSPMVPVIHRKEKLTIKEHQHGPIRVATQPLKKMSISFAVWKKTSA